MKKNKDVNKTQISRTNQINIEKPHRKSVQPKAYGTLNQTRKEQTQKENEQQVISNDDRKKIVAIQKNISTTNSKNYSPDSVRSSIKIKHKITIAGDSQAKGLKTFLTRKLPTSWQIFEKSYTGDTICQILSHLENAPHSMENLVLLIGANGIMNTEWTEISNKLKITIENNRKVKIFFFLIPFRNDRTQLNKHVANLNTKLKDLCDNYSQVEVINTQKLIKRNIHMAKDGVYINNQGKAIIADKICNVLTEQGNNAESSSVSILSENDKNKDLDDFHGRSNENFNRKYIKTKTFYNKNQAEYSCNEAAENIHKEKNNYQTNNIPTQNYNTNKTHVTSDECLKKRDLDHFLYPMMTKILQQLMETRQFQPPEVQQTRIRHHTRYKQRTTYRQHWQQQRY